MCAVPRTPGGLGTVRDSQLLCCYLVTIETDRQTDRQTGKDRQRDTETDRQIDRRVRHMFFIHSYFIYGFATGPADMMTVAKMINGLSCFRLV